MIQSKLATAHERIHPIAMVMVIVEAQEVGLAHEPRRARAHKGCLAHESRRAQGHEDRTTHQLARHSRLKALDNLDNFHGGENGGGSARREGPTGLNDGTDDNDNGNGDSENDELGTHIDNGNVDDSGAVASSGD